MRLVVAQKTAVAGETGVVPVRVHAFDKIRKLLHGRIIRDPITDEPLAVFGPELVIAAADFLAQFHQWLPVDFQNDPVRREMWEHPFQGKAFLYVERIVGIAIENRFRQ